MTKILIVEDDPQIREEVLFWLSLEDYEAIGASNGREGVELAQSYRPDLIISDIMMPEKDGYRVLLEVRTQPATALTPFIFLTAKQEKADIRYGMELGADDYITKPFEREEFLRAIQARLNRQQQYAHESEEQVNRLRQNFLRTLPHELRTPLVGILGIGELLMQDADSLTPAEIVDYAGLITSSGQQLYRIIENYLLYTQLEQLAADPEQAALLTQGRVTQTAAILRETSERLASKHMRSSDLSLTIQPALVQIERQDLTKIIYELVDNAFKFSKAPARVQVNAAVQDDTYVILVTDQGRGMTPENIAAIAPYVQFERATYEQQGTGLGLAIVRRLLELTGGACQITSTVNVGTQVRITIPIQTSKL
jgi:signal transduction histidine kinase